MEPRLRAGAVIYARDKTRLASFYQNVLGFEVAAEAADHVVLESPSFQLVILQAPPHIAESIEIDDPPRRRSETPVKLVFFVASLAAMREKAPEFGGNLDLPAREWQFDAMRVCDGNDPEGNIVQFRETARGSLP